MTGWTFSSVKVQNLTLEAYCRNDSCRRFYIFDLDQLITTMGPDYLVSDIPQLSCEACGGPMEVKLALVPPQEDEV